MSCDMSTPANKLYIQTKDLIPGNLAIDNIFTHLVCSPTFLSSPDPSRAGWVSREGLQMDQ